MKYLIKNGRVVDPVSKMDEELDILIADGKIDNIGKGLVEKADEVIDARGKIVAPGLVDMHAHLREPGREDEETIATGTRSAARGGFTAIACMPNTEPVIDDPKKAKALAKIIAGSALVNVYMMGAITMDRAGKRLVDVKGMKGEGAVALSDDGYSVDDPHLLSEALKESKKASLLIIEHCEDRKISANGVMNEGFISTKMGLKGIPRAAEHERVKRDIALAGKAEARIHIAHVSCAESVELIRKAKKSGVKVTAETAPHYFSLTEDCCVTYDTNTKMNPPLRTKEDAAAIKEGLKDGTIETIATDHAPHTDSEKYVEFDFAPFGIIGLETLLSLSFMELVEKRILTWGELIMKISANPSAILGIRGGTLRKGHGADIVVIDPSKEYIYKRESIESKSKNSPFMDWRLKAKVTDLFVGGRPVMRGERL